MLSQGKNGRQVPFQEPAGGWTRWSSSSEDGRQLKTLLQNGTIHNGMSALDVQIYFPQFQCYAPSNFCKNLSRIRRESGVKAAGTPPAVPIPPVSGAPAATGAVPMAPPAPIQAPPNPFPTENHVSFATAAVAVSPSPAPVPEEDEDEMMMLPHLFKVMDNGRYKSATLQLLCMSAPMKWTIKGNSLVGRYIMSDNFTNPKHALGKFKNADGSPAFPENHIARVAHEKAVYEKQGDDLSNKIKWVMKLDLGMKMSFHMRDGFEKKIIVFSKSGEYHQYINLIEEGALARIKQQDDNETILPSHISVSGGATVMDDVDNMTTQFSTFGAGPTGDRDDYTFQSVRSNGSFRSASMQSVQSMRSRANSRRSFASPTSLRRTDVNPALPVRQQSTSQGSTGSFAGGPNRNPIDAAAAAGAAAAGDEESTFSVRSRAPKRVRGTPSNAIVCVDPDI